MTAVVSSDWLAARLGQNGSDWSLQVLDGSWYLPGAGRDPLGEYTASHLDGAQFFDLSQIHETQGLTPNMLPPPTRFQRNVRRLGINREATIIVYDGAGLFSSARVWWMFRAMGFDNIFVLDGGLPKWTDEGRPLTAEAPGVRSGEFKARLRRDLIVGWEGVLAASQSGERQILDARAAARYAGSSPEPRVGVRAGHIPGSINIPHTSLKTEDGVLKAPQALKAVFEQAGVDLAQPIITSCGSGITACILALALFQIGVPDVAVYDGSWAQWGARNDLPIETG